MPQGELAGVSQPSMAAVLESIVGPWGSIFIRVGVIVSVLGAYLAWTLMAAEVLYIPAKTDDMPRFLARTNSNGAPVSALIMAAGSDFTAARRAAVRRGRARFHARPDRRAVPDSLSSRGGVRAEADGSLARPTVTANRCSRHGHRRGGDGVHAVPDLCGGSRQASLSCVLYAPAAVLYFIARRERGLRVFRPAEAVLFGVIVLGAVAGVVSLATGAIAI